MPAEQADRAHRGCTPAGHASKPARLCLHCGSGLAANDRLKEAPDIGGGQVLERLFPEQRDNVAGDPASIDFESAGLFGQALSPDDEPGLGFG